ncbi:MAG: MMPL family transporter [Bacteroidota bacterium]
MYEEISSGDTYSQSLHFLDNKFGGIRPVEIYVASNEKDNSLLDFRNMQKLDSLQNYLEQTYKANSIYSILVQVKRLNRVYYQGNPEHFNLPEEPKVYETITQVLDSNFYAMELQNILAKDKRSTLIQAKIQDLGSHEISMRNKDLMAYGEKLFPPDQYEFKLTGKAQILDKSNVLITQHLGYGLLIALGIVALLMGILFRSAGIIALAFIPNLLPLLFIAGLMGILGIGLKMSTAIIFSIAFGIAVDDTIHFLSRLKFEWQKGVCIEEAVQKTYLSTGKAIIITSIILILGFGILLFSGFQATFTSGLFISLALIFAVFADLLLLPVLLLKAYKKKEIKESGKAAYN